MRASVGAQLPLGTEFVGCSNLDSRARHVCLTTWAATRSWMLLVAEGAMAPLRRRLPLPRLCLALAPAVVSRRPLATDGVSAGGREGRWCGARAGGRGAGQCDVGTGRGGFGPAPAVHGPHGAPTRHLTSDCAKGLATRTQQDGDVPPQARALRTAATLGSRRTTPGLRRPPRSSSTATRRRLALPCARSHRMVLDQRELLRSMCVSLRRHVLCGITAASPRPAGRHI